MNPAQLTGYDDTQLTTLKFTTLSMDEQHILVHPEVKSSLATLITAAQQAGFDLHIASGYRNFERQCFIWNNKYSGQTPILNNDSQPLDKSLMTDYEKVFAILRWSALPGASRHHWGSDFDIYAKNLLPDHQKLCLEPWEYTNQGHQAPLFQWLQANITKYQFFFPYQQDNGGVAVEPWHISYQPYTQQALVQLTPALWQQQIQLIQQQKPELTIAGMDIIKPYLDSIFQQFIYNIDNPQHK